ncbi:MAG: hypothetical protein JO197_17910 [Acidobacteria bacterium]|nr:hypothetical protein [Acidobacteriota bacterium]MBV9478981.1 hypothetical protein [Acidobacteriota bacterium]
MSVDVGTGMEVIVLERVPMLTPLAVRFRDEATREYASSSLLVQAYPEGLPELRTSGLANPSGIFVFRDLPWMRDVEHGDGDDAFWATQTTRTFIVEVRDLGGLYLPCWFSVEVPHRGVFGIDYATSPPAAPFVPLFSAPTRNAPDGMGVLRAELIDAETGEPAAWALVEAKAGEQRLVTGMADAQGRVMLPLFYPKPVITLGSPGSVNTPLTQQTWAVDFTVRYRRRTPVPALPDLVDVLTQPPATAWEETSPLTPWTQTTLQFGRELRLSTHAGGGATPTLLITPAGSPP